MVAEDIVIEESDIQLDIDSIDFSDIEEKYAVAAPSPLDSVIIVDCLPVVDESKEPKLMNILQKILSKFGYDPAANALYMPMKENAEGVKMSQGFLFVEFQSAEKAADFCRQCNGYRLDKNHVFATNRMSDYEKIMKVSEDYTPPVKEEYKEREHLSSWLLDEHGRGQFMSLAADELSVLWNNKKDEAEVDHTRTNWTDSLARWSPLGNYLVTFHRQGVALWGGKSWERLVRFIHSNVRFIHFSPKENYLITHSDMPNFPKSDCFRVWDAKTGKLLREFSLPKAQLSSSALESAPRFKWSSNEQYMARVGNDVLHVYEVPSMKPLAGTQIKAPGIVDFEWSPASSALAFWTPELVNNPARVTLMEIPSKSIVRTKNLFKVSHCLLSWQSDGDYLAVKVERVTKTKKSSFFTLEVFAIREKDVPIDIYEGFGDGTVLSVAWEPNGYRFITVAVDSQQKILISFFKMEGGNLKLDNVMERKNVSDIAWSPTGRFVVFAALRNFNGELEFFDADEMQTMATSEHYQASDIEWDPTGRFVATCSSFLRAPGDNGFIIWDFRGQQLQKVNIPKFKIFQWRPLPPSLLSKDAKKSVRKNLKKYADEFEKADSLLSSTADREAYNERSRLRSEWSVWRESCVTRYVKEREERALLRGSGEVAIYSDEEDL